MNQQAVKEYVERSQRLIESSPQMDEQNTKVRLIQPFLELLGWDLYSTEVELEYTIQIGTGTTHVDYALLIGDAPVIFLEAKPVRSALTQHDIQQLKSYMRQELNVDWGILTNGKTFEVLTKNRQQADGEEVSVAQFNLDDLATNPDVMGLLSKEAIRSGRADEIVDQLAQTNAAIRTLREEEDRITDAVTEAVAQETGDLTIDLQAQSREFVQNLVSVLEDQRQFVSEEQLEEPQTGVPTLPEDEYLENHLAGTCFRDEIEGEDDARVAVFPSKPSGQRFLFENEAWGFVNVGRDFDYVAIYISDDVREVKYIASVDAVVEPAEADLVRDLTEYEGDGNNAEKMVVKFQPGSLYELSDPIPFAGSVLRSLRYTTLGKLRTAETTDDLF